MSADRVLFTGLPAVLTLAIHGGLVLMLVVSALPPVWAVRRSWPRAVSLVILNLRAASEAARSLIDTPGARGLAHPWRRCRR